MSEGTMKSKRIIFLINILVIVLSAHAVATTAFTAPTYRRHVLRNRSLSSRRNVLSKPGELETPLFESTDESAFENVDKLQESVTYPLGFNGLSSEQIGGGEQSSRLSLQDDETSNAAIGIWTARALLVLVAVLWGTNFAAVKYLETLCFHPPCRHLPSEAALARFGVAAIACIPLLVGQRKDVILAGVECGFWITFGYITQAMALQSIGAGECAFICSLTVVVVPLLSSLLFGKEIKPVHVASAAVALSGVGILEGLIDVSALLPTQPALAATVSAAAPQVATASTHLVASSVGTAQSWFGLGKGDLLALGQPLGFGLAFMRIEHYVEKFKDVENRIITISAAQCVIVGLLSFLWVLYDFHGTLPSFNYMMEPHRIAAVAWTGIMTTVVAIYLEGVALQTASATEAALTFASEPVWASFFGVWLLHEHLGMDAYVGGAVILSACIMGALADLPGETTTTAETEKLL